MNPAEQLHNVPGVIRRWFGSEEVVDILVELEEKYGLDPDESALTFLLFDLEVKNIQLDELEGEIAYDLEVSPHIAHEIYEDIKTRILMPIAPELVAFGIGTSELDFVPKPATIPAPAPLPERVQVTAPPSSLQPEPRPIPTQETPEQRVYSQVVDLPQKTAQAPVSLYRDALQSQTLASSGQGLGDISRAGDLSSRVSSMPPAQRPARVDLGMRSSMKVDDTLKSIFVQRETPKVQAIDYGASRPAAAAMPAASPVPLSSGPTSPLPSGTAPFTPHVEVVSMPLKHDAEPQQDDGGIVDSLMRHVAPWHYAKFGAASAHPAEALEEPVPGHSVDYSETPSTPAPNPQPSGALPLSDLSAPRPPQA